MIRIQSSKSREFGRYYLAIAATAAALLLAFVVHLELRTIHLYGKVWEEPFFSSFPASALTSGLFLERWYPYPGFAPRMAFAALLPDLVSYWSQDLESRSLLNYLIDRASEESFFFRTRILFVLVSYLATVWTFVWAYKIRNSALEAFMAAALLASTWELFYHSRWISPNTVMMQFAALVGMLLSLSFSNRPRPVMVYLAGFFSGLACACKYPAGLLLMPVLVRAFFLKGEGELPQGLSGRFGRMMVCTSLCLVAFLGVTPGILVEPAKFLADTANVVNWYRSGHVGYSVSAGFEHLWLMIVYLFGVSLSSSSLVSVGFSIVIVAGIIKLFKEDPQKAIVFSLFPALYLALFTMQRVMIVRNLQIIVPFLAIFFSYGVGSLRAHFWGRHCVLVLVPVFIFGNYLWLYNSTLSLRDSAAGDYISEAYEYLKSSDSVEKYWLSPKVTAGFAAAGFEPLDAARASTFEEANFVALFTDEVQGTSWVANRFGYFTRVFGPLDVNLNYYPTWASGRDGPGVARIVILPSERAKLLSFALAASP